MIKASTIAARAAEVVEERGHTKGRSMDSKTGCVCLVGGIYQALADHNVRGHAAEDTDSLIREYLVAMLKLPNPTGWSVPEWNDAEERTAEEVIAALKNVSEILRKEDK